MHVQLFLTLHFYLLYLLLNSCDGNDTFCQVLTSLSAHETVQFL